MRPPSIGELRVRPWMWIALSAGCGQMVQAPGGQPPRPPPSASAAQAAAAPSGAPGRAGADDAETGSEPVDPSGPQSGPHTGPDAGSSGEPYAGVTPAAAHRPARRAPPGDADGFMQAHNQVRAKHCAAPLTWSPELAQVAQRWANSLRDQGCMFGHSGGAYGENLAAGTSGTLDPEAVVKMWSDEVGLYKFPDGGFSMKTGHFTQVVWRGTRQVGCGRTQCKGMDIWVCEYDPPGNWEGQYRANVLPSGCR